MGGYVLYMRHTSKDQSKTEEKDREDFDNCSWQNDLTEIGRGEAKQLGEIFSELGIPIADVLSSPYCRCINTARLAFGQSVKRVAALRSTDGVSSNEKMKGLQDELDRLLNTPPPTGKNTVIVGHSTNLKKVTGILPEEAPEGSTTIFLPHPGSQWQCFQTILLKGWKIEK
ncbi:MAG: histidine phosphatase family protein [Candidatus Omnitrophica bacterium]|nr:histidine phosphatase family protein [Candidatus Omnitrophota bacterium]